MSKFAIRLLTLAMFSLALIAAPLLSTAYAAGGDNPAPPASDSGKEKKKTDKGSSIDDPEIPRRLSQRPMPRSMTATITPRRSSN